MTEIYNADQSMLISQRDLFEIPDDITYLNCAAISPQMRSVTAAGFESLKSKITPWSVPAEYWSANAEILKELAAKIMGAEAAQSVAVIPSVSYGIAVAAANVRVERGQTILLLHNEFPSNYYVWKELAKKSGASINLVQKNDGETWTQAILEAIDENTAVASVPNCHWTDGSLVDHERIGEKARSIGAAFVVDASQSLGAYPLDIEKVQPDFLITTGYKWLLCPYTLCFMYAAPKWQEAGTPIEFSWFNRRGSENPARMLDYVEAYQPGARRFEMGEFHYFAFVPMAIAALRQINDWRVEKIQKTLSVLTNSIAEKATELGFSVSPPEDRVGHFIGIRHPNCQPDELVARLAKENLFVSVRGDAIRIAPYLYNDERDIEKLFAVLQTLV